MGSKPSAPKRPPQKPGAFARSGEFVNLQIGNVGTPNFNLGNIGGGLGVGGRGSGTRRDVSNIPTGGRARDNLSIAQQNVLTRQGAQRDIARERSRLGAQLQGFTSQPQRVEKIIGTDSDEVFFRARLKGTSFNTVTGGKADTVSVIKRPTTFDVFFDEEGNRVDRKTERRIRKQLQQTREFDRASGGNTGKRETEPTEAEERQAQLDAFNKKRRRGSAFGFSSVNRNTKNLASGTARFGSGLF